MKHARDQMYHSAVLSKANRRCCHRIRRRGSFGVSPGFCSAHFFSAFCGAWFFDCRRRCIAHSFWFPRPGADPIQSPHQAIISRVAVTEGEIVKKGAELFVLRSDEIRGLTLSFRP